MGRNFRKWAPFGWVAAYELADRLLTARSGRLQPRVYARRLRFSSREVTTSPDGTAAEFCKVPQKPREHDIDQSRHCHFNLQAEVIFLLQLARTPAKAGPPSAETAVASGRVERLIVF